MVNGNSVICQYGKESTYGTAASMTKQIKISNESLKPIYTKIDEGVATGGRGAGLKQTMAKSVEGTTNVLGRPDMGLLLKALCGVDIVAPAGDNFKHTFTALGTELTDSLPSLTFTIDRKVKVFKYTGVKINSMNFDCAPGDFLKLTVNVIGKEETTGSINDELAPSDKKAFRFAGAKVYADDTEIADVTNISFSYNNNLDAQTQTTGTGDFYKEAQPGTRQISLTTSMIYSASSEQIREALYKTDDTCSIRIEFVSGDYKLTITIPCMQCSDADANMGGLETLPQNMTFEAVDNLEDELITFELINDESGLY